MTRQTNPTPLTPAQQQLVRDNVGLAYWQAYRIFNGSKYVRDRLGGEDEAVAAALYGLVLAARAFDPERGVKFSTYATRTIINQVYREAKTASVIHVPEWAGSGQKSRPASEEILRAAARAIAAIPLPDNYDATPAREPTHHLVDEHAPAMLAAIAQLDERERAVIRGRYFESQTLGDVGARLGVCKERVRQIQEGALAKLRAAMGAGAVA